MNMFWMVCLISFLSLFFRYPSYLSSSPPTATSTYGKKSSSNQVNGPRFFLIFVIHKQSYLIPLSAKGCSPFCKLLTVKFSSASAGTIRLKILPKIETKGMTTDDVTSLSDKSFNLMRSAFLNVSDSVTQSNGPLRHWTDFTTLPPLFSPMSLSETRSSPRPPRSPLARKQHDTGLLSWNLFLSSWRLVQSASGPTIQHSQSRPSLCLQQHRQQQRCSARRERSDGRQAEQYGCVLFFMHAFFGWLCPPASLLCSLASEAWLFYRLTLSRFCTFNFGLFLLLFFSVCLLFHASISSFMRSSHVAFVLNTHMHTRIQSSPPHHLPFLSVLSPPFLHSSLLPKDKRSGVSTSGGVCGGERSTQVGRGLLWFCRCEFNSISMLALQVND